MCFHRWGSWKIETIVKILSGEDTKIPVGQEVIQSKQCLKCGYVKFDKQRI